MVFSEESTVGAFLLRARREGLRDFGACMSPHTAWLILQGIETLPLRMERHMSNTRKVVSSWPRMRSSTRGLSDAGVASQPCARAEAAAQGRGSGSVFSFDMKGSRDAGQGLHRGAQAVQPPGQRGRLPLAGDPPGQHHALPHDDEALAQAGITPGTIRLSIGLEDAGRPDRRPEARAEGGGEGRVHEAHRQRRPRPSATPAASPSTGLPTVVFIHGVLNDHSVWILQTRYFAHHGWNVLAVDLPGHAAAKASRRPAWRKAADFVLALLDSGRRAARRRWSATASAR
jgi:hypothetical protein